MIKERINALRTKMSAESIDMYVVPTSDFHGSEYVGAYFKCREFLSGFTGSNGTLLVSRDHAALWTDGRYFLQAEDELKGSGIELMKMGEEGVPTLSGYIRDNLPENGCLGFDGRVFSVSEGIDLKNAAESKKGTLKIGLDLVDGLWSDRPSLSHNPVYVWETCYAGKTAAEKLADLRAEMNQKECTHHILSSLDDIAWLLNLRGSDVDCNPVFLAYLIVSEKDGILFAHEDAVSSVREHLNGLNITVRPYNDIYGYIKELAGNPSVLIDDTKLNYSLYSTLEEVCKPVKSVNPTTPMKAVKNETERENLRKVNVTDGVAMVRFIRWLKENVSSGTEKVTEISAAKKLEEIRSKGKGYKGLSFETISGYNAHGAIIHYEPTGETDVEVKNSGLLLVDSGAQYLGGTTDITRTIAVGPLTPEMKHHYTMVLRGHLALMAAVFREGCSGANLDILARAPFWDEYEDYNHGTGHGIGCFLNVHEGPQSFHYNTQRRSTLTKLEEGMVITDEPGIYIEGKYGVRIENDLLCLKDKKTEYGQFMHFEALTLCPIDLEPVNFDELTEKERKTLSEYHKMVLERLTPELSEDDANWLKSVI